MSLYNPQKQIAPSDGDVERENGVDVSLGGRTGWPVLFPLRKEAKSCWHYRYNTKNSSVLGSADFVGDFKVDLRCCTVHCLPKSQTHHWYFWLCNAYLPSAHVVTLQETHNCLLHSDSIKKKQNLRLKIKVAHVVPSYSRECGEGDRGYRGSEGRNLPPSERPAPTALSSV